MTLINAIISSPEDLDFRLHLRNEFMRIGLLEVLEVREIGWQIGRPSCHCAYFIRNAYRF